MTHDELRELAPAYALGALEPRERGAVEAHVASCPGCRAEVSELREVAALLALAAPSVDAARLSALRTRVVADASRVRPLVAARDAAPVPRAPRSAWSQTTTWLAAASILVAAIAAGGWWQARREEVRLAKTLAQTSETLAERDSVLSAFFGPMVHVVSLSEGENQKPSARVFWNHTRKEFIITAFNIPPAPAGKTYQLWAIRNGQAPLSMGTFNTDANGRALAVLPVGEINDAGYIDNCALTLEPAGGSPQPTETPRLVGAWRHVD